MLQVIGLMVGCYIIVRVVSLMLREGVYNEHTFVRVIAGLNILVTLLLMADLILGGHKGL